MYSPESRRTRGDLKAFQICQAGRYGGLKFELRWSYKRAWAEVTKLEKSHFSRDVRKHFYNKVINEWNGLPAYVVHSKGVEEFG